jgi:UDP-glucuronate 4-epimerase
MTKKKILITGAAGFLGFYLSKVLLNEEYTVVGLDNLNNYYDVKLKYSRLNILGINVSSINYGEQIKNSTGKNFSFIKLNLEDKKSLIKLFENEKFDFVCNLAAQAGVRYSLVNPDQYINSNIVGFTNILEMCREFKIKHLLYASSSSVYGLNKKMPFSTSDNVDHPISLYAATKKSNELFAHTYSHLFEIPTTGMRFFTVYGPWGRPDMALFQFTDSILKGIPINVYNDGNMYRDFTYVDDIIESIKRLILIPPIINSDNNSVLNPSMSSAPYKIYNIGNGNPIKLTEFINTIEKKLGINAIKNLMPIQQGDVSSTYADITELKNKINFTPNTSIEDGVNKFIDWYLNFYK